MLGGVHIEDADRGLAGHSDADAVCHAVCDALLGAASLGDIGDHFPDTDPRYKDYPGVKFLAHVKRMITNAGFKIENIDCVVMCDVVKLGSRKREMAHAIAAALELEDNRVNVGATTFEGKGAVGRGEVLACEAIALLNDS